MDRGGTQASREESLAPAVRIGTLLGKDSRNGGSA